jgi:hypothetical protein
MLYMSVGSQMSSGSDSDIVQYTTATGPGICTMDSFRHAARFGVGVGVLGDGIKLSASSTLLEA